MNIVFRCDASTQIGTGHVMRCLTLANALQQQGHDTTFVCRQHNGNLIAQIQQQGHQTVVLDKKPQSSLKNDELLHAHWLGSTQKEDAQHCISYLQQQKCDWLIVDHYALDEAWEKSLRPYAQHIMAIDDLADRVHDCDILLDQNFGRKEQNYRNLVPPQCQILVGTQYALLRPEFAQWREYSLERRRQNSTIKKLLINMGGADKDNVTTQVLQALIASNLPKDCLIQIVMGAISPHIDIVKSVAKNLPWQTQVMVNVDNMAELMANADVAIGASGSTTWERCCLGLPCILIAIAKNQQYIAVCISKLGAAICIDQIILLSQILNDFLHHFRVRSTEMAEKSSYLVDGNGVNRLINNLVGI